MSEILCIGKSCYDINFYADKFPTENLKYEITESLEEGGGPAANAAYLLAFWGVPTSFGGIGGDDKYYEAAKEQLQSVGVDTSLYISKKGLSTSLSVILVNSANGSRTIINRVSCKTKLTLEKDNLTGMNPKILLFDGHELEASLKAMEVFPEAITVLDAGSLREGTKILVDKVDYLISSERFATQICGLEKINPENINICLKALKENIKGELAVTFGEKGVYFVNGQEVERILPFDAFALDTTGAGDIFHGAFCYGIFKGLDFKDSLLLSSAAGALSVTKRGARASVPELEAVLKLFRTRKDSL